MAASFDEVPIRKITVTTRFRKDMGDLDALAESIRGTALIEPIVVNRDYILLAGARRLKACEQAGLSKVPVHILDTNKVFQIERDENEFRKPFTVSERVAIGRAVEEELKQAESEPKSEDNGDAPQNFVARPQKSPGKKQKRENPKAEAAAEAAGFDNRETYRQAGKVVDSAVAEVITLMDEGKIRPSAALRVARLTKEQQRKVARKIRDGIKPPKAIREVLGVSPQKDEPPPGSGDAYEGPKDKTEAAEEKEAQEAAAVPRDALGVEIPKKLRDVFGDGTLKDMAGHCKDVLRFAKANQRLYPFLLLEAVTKAAKELKSLLEAAIPHALHVACEGKGCEECRKAGYLPKWRLEELEGGGS